MKNLDKNIQKTPICELTPIFELFGQKWTTVILSEILNGNNHYGTLRKKFATMSSRTLSARLKTLENNGIITRTVYPVIPPSVEYQLTPKGKDARKMFTAMIDWKNQW